MESNRAKVILKQKKILRSLPVQIRQLCTYTEIVQCYIGIRLDRCPGKQKIKTGNVPVHETFVV
jgi:hypothetical protein